MKFIIKYGIFALVSIALLIVATVFQWVMFGELNVYERLAMLAVAVTVYIPFAALQIGGVVKSKLIDR